MESIESLRRLLSVLSNEEHRELKSLLSKRNKNDDASESKPLLLVNYLLDERKYSAIQIQKILYPDLNYHAFNKLKNRLKEKILEVVIRDSSIKSNSFSQRNVTIFELRKLLIKADILQLKGYRFNLLNLYDLIISRSKRVEVYDITLQALYSKRRLMFGSVSEQKIKKLNSEIDQVEKGWLLLNRAQNVFRDITNKISVSSDSNSYHEQLVSSLKIIESFISEFESPSLRYYYFTLLAEKSQIDRDYEKCNMYFHKIRNLLEANISIYTENRLGSVLLNLANNEVLLGNFNEAIRIGEESRRYFKNLKLTQKIVDENNFYANFYLKNFHECERYVTEAVNDRTLQNSEYLLGKFNFYHACLLFYQDRFVEAVDLLTMQSEIKKDKEGWNICRRILLIMCRIELEEVESADLQIHNLQKYLKRIKKLKHLRPRYTLIVNLLIKLLNSNLQYKSFSFEKDGRFSALFNNQDYQFGWRLKSPELVRFDHWFLKKFGA